ncbi:Protein of unknown function [Gryllus bimaculatus]|nr:Protein of unknown function [Gryllus bimaculatus]
MREREDVTVCEFVVSLCVLSVLDTSAQNPLWNIELTGTDHDLTPNHEWCDTAPTEGLYCPHWYSTLWPLLKPVSCLIGMNRIQKATADRVGPHMDERNKTSKKDIILHYLIVGKNQSLLNTPNVFFISFALPGINRNTTLCHCSSSMVLSAENIATRPLHLKKIKIRHLFDNQRQNCFDLCCDVMY